MIQFGTMQDFTEWLQEELKSRSWRNVDLVEKGEIDPSTVSRLLNGLIKKPKDDTLRGIARAFGYSPEEVFRRAGLLPPIPQNGYNETIQRLVSLVSQLPEAYQQDILDYAEWRYSQFLDEDPAESIKLLGDELERIFSLLNPGERATILSQAARDRRFRNMAQEIIRRKSL